MKPIIGVMPLWDEAKSSIWMLPDYLDLIRDAGALPLIFPMDVAAADVEQLCGICDGFLLTGGDDVDPALYGEEVSERCGATNSRRDSLERVVFNYAIEHDLPMLGICRGIQFINALLGGTLYQDLPSERGAVDGVNHQMTPPYDREVHRVRIVEGTPLWDIVGEEWLGVNSYHHQAVKDLAPSLVAMAYSEDGLIEALYIRDRRFVEAYQWHPELNFKVCKVSREIVKRFVECAAQR